MARLSGIAWAIAAALLALALPAAVAAAPVPLDQAGSLGTGAGQLSAPQDLVVDGAGEIYVADSGNNRIVQFDAEGDFVRTFGWGVDTGALAYEVCTTTCTSGYSGGGAGQLFLPTGLALDGAGSLFVVSPNNHRVDQFNVAGAQPTFTKAFGYDVQTGTGSTFQVCTTTCFQGNSGNDAGGQLDAPSGIDFASGTVLVVDRGNDRISVFNPATPAHLVNFGSPGTGAGQFINAEDVTVGAGGIFVTDQAGANRISRFAPGAPPSFQHAFGWDVDPNGAPGMFEVCTPDTTCISGAPGPGAGQVDHPIGLDVDASGNLWLADFNNNRVQQFATAGPSFTQTFGFGVNTGATGTFEVCTNPSGCTLGSNGSGFGQPTQPVGVAVDSCGAVWVSEQGNDRIERFGEAGTPPAPPCTASPSPSPSPPSNTFSFGKAKLNRKKGTATLPVNAPGPGTLALSGKGIKGASAQTSGAVASASTVKLTVKAKGKTAKTLKRKRKAKVKASVTFTPTGGSANTETKKLTLKRDR